MTSQQSSANQYMLLPMKKSFEVEAHSSWSLGRLRVRTTRWPPLSWGPVSASASHPPWISPAFPPWSPQLPSGLLLGRCQGRWMSGPGPGVQGHKQKKWGKWELSNPVRRISCLFTSLKYFKNLSVKQKCQTAFSPFSLRSEILIWNSGHCFSIYTPLSATQTLSLSISPTFNLSSLSISLVLIYSEGRDGIHYLSHTNPSLVMVNASLAHQ